MNCDMQMIYKDYSTHLLNFIRQQVRDKDWAEDILQDVFLKVMESCIRDIEINSIKSWLFQVSRNTIVDYYRKQNKNFNEDDYVELNHLHSADFQQILSNDVARMIALLPEEYGEPLRLSDLEGISQQEVANRLNISLPGAKSRIQRARKKLRDLFFECCDVELDAQGNIISCVIKPSCKPLREE